MKIIKQYGLNKLPRASNFVDHVNSLTFTDSNCSQGSEIKNQLPRHSRIIASDCASPHLSACNAQAGAYSSEAKQSRVK